MGKPKQIKFSLIDPDGESLPYRLMAEIRRQHHQDTADAKIALAWRIDTNPDVDGHLVLGRCIKASDLQRELVDWDFVIVLNKEVWGDPEFTVEKKRALLDHELCHAAVSFGDVGKKVDNRGRKVWRIRKHDIEEFQDVISRHGCYKRDLERFAEVLIARKQSPLFNKPTSDTTVSVGIEDDDGEIEYSEPITLNEFSQRCEAVSRMRQ